MREVAVLGLGNVLMGDDALGPHVVHELARGWEFPENVRIEDLGTPGFDLIPFLADKRAVIIVDTVMSDGPAGTVRLYRKEQILKHAPQPRVTPHDPALKECLLSLEFSGNAPEEVVLIGVVPKGTENVCELSQEVRAALPAAVDAVLGELERLGRPAVRRSRVRESKVWWETAS